MYIIKSVLKLWNKRFIEYILNILSYVKYINLNIAFVSPHTRLSKGYMHVSKLCWLGIFCDGTHIK